MYQEFVTARTTQEAICERQGATHNDYLVLGQLLLLTRMAAEQDAPQKWWKRFVKDNCLPLTYSAIWPKE